jgi:hypothetical protein
MFTHFLLDNLKLVFLTQKVFQLEIFVSIDVMPSKLDELKLCSGNFQVVVIVSFEVFCFNIFEVVSEEAL